MWSIPLILGQTGRYPSVENHSPRRHGGHGVVVSTGYSPWSPCLRGWSSSRWVGGTQAHV